MPHKAYTGISLPRWNLKSLTLASYPQQSAFYAILPAKVNWRSSASGKSLPRSRKTPFDLGCSRDTSRGCVGRRCTVLSYTFRSHPYQNTVERGWCSKVFFGLRNNDAYALASQQYTLRTMPSSATMEGTISSERRALPRANFAAATTALKKRKNIGENGSYFVSLQMDVSA